MPRTGKGAVGARAKSAGATRAGHVRYGWATARPRAGRKHAHSFACTESPLSHRILCGLDAAAGAGNGNVWRPRKAQVNAQQTVARRGLFAYGRSEEVPGHGTR